MWSDFVGQDPDSSYNNSLNCANAMERASSMSELRCALFSCFAKKVNFSTHTHAHKRMSRLPNFGTKISNTFAPQIAFFSVDRLKHLLVFLKIALLLQVRLTFFACNEGKVLLDGHITVDYVRAETRVQVVRPEVLFHPVIAHYPLFGY